MSVPLPFLVLPLLVTASPGAAGDAKAQQESASADAQVAARGLGGIVVHLDELERTLLERYGGSPDGREVLDLLLKSALLERLARDASIVVSDEDVSRRWQVLDRRMQAAGEKRGLAAEIERRGLSVAEFRDFLRLSLVQERLARRALEREPDAAVSGEEQEVWLEGEIARRGLERRPPPWSDGVVARCGDVVIDTDTFSAFLRRRLGHQQVSETCWHLLLQRALERRLPDLSPEARERAIDAEIERRRAKHAAELPGVPFEQRLGTSGRTIELLRGDPSTQIAALSRIWVDRAHGPKGLRETYESERAFFEGRFGRAVRTHMIFLVAGRFANDLNQRTYEMAEEELEEIRTRIGNLDDFEALATRLSEEPTTRDAEGALGWVTKGDPRIPAPLRAAVFEFLDTGGRIPAGGAGVGPVRTDAGCALLWVSEVRESPDWEVMSEHVHEELRRRLIEEAMPTSSVEILIDGAGVPEEAGY